METRDLQLEGLQTPIAITTDENGEERIVFACCVEPKHGPFKCIDCPHKLKLVTVSVNGRRAHFAHVYPYDYEGDKCGRTKAAAMIPKLVLTDLRERLLFYETCQVQKEKCETPITTPITSGEQPKSLHGIEYSFDATNIKVITKEKEMEKGKPETKRTIVCYMDKVTNVCLSWMMIIPASKKVKFENWEYLYEKQKKHPQRFICAISASEIFKQFEKSTGGKGVIVSEESEEETKETTKSTTKTTSTSKTKTTSTTKEKTNNNNQLIKIQVFSNRFASCKSCKSICKCCELKNYYIQSDQTISKKDKLHYQKLAKLKQNCLPNEFFNLFEFHIHTNVKRNSQTRKLYALYQSYFCAPCTFELTKQNAFPTYSCEQCKSTFGLSESLITIEKDIDDDMVHFNDNNDEHILTAITTTTTSTTTTTTTGTYCRTCVDYITCCVCKQYHGNIKGKCVKDTEVTIYDEQPEDEKSDDNHESSLPKLKKWNQKSEATICIACDADLKECEICEFRSPTKFIYPIPYIDGTRNCCLACLIENQSRCLICGIIQLPHSDLISKQLGSIPKIVKLVFYNDKAIFEKDIQKDKEKYQCKTCHEIVYENQTKKDSLLMISKYMCIPKQQKENVECFCLPCSRKHTFCIPCQKSKGLTVQETAMKMTITTKDKALILCRENLPDSDGYYYEPTKTKRKFSKTKYRFNKKSK